jgi:hypothetical protein
MHQSPFPSPSKVKVKVATIGVFLLTCIAAAGYIGFSLATGDNSRVRWPWLNEAFGFGMTIVSPVAILWLIWRLYRIAKTVLTDEELIQPNLGAPSRLRWSEVVNARLERENLRLESAGLRVVIAAGMYASPESVVAFIASKIKCPVQGRNAA